MDCEQTIIIPINELADLYAKREKLRILEKAIKTYDSDYENIAPLKKMFELEKENEDE